ncbi:AI-2E family transporter [Polluticaenibacter yanchengensis]|uniref:AI-2E family transporter n=1 Tax=Polluticaenibacter yanchengensis TaxID=3014562 RepID=A0ABT4UG11_9BACT|nr:AI-2E family transporter [Chitinophagaceae bacterium LY-5]
MDLKTNVQIHPNKIRQILILSLVIIIGYILFREMTFMISSFLGAVAFYMILRLTMFKMVYQWKWKKWLAALTLIILSLLVIVLPLSLIINQLLDKLLPYIQDTTTLENNVYKVQAYLQSKFHVDVLSTSNMEKIPDLITKAGTSVIGGSFNMIMNLIIMYFILWFMLVSGGEMERYIRNNLPFKNTNTATLLKELRASVISNAIGIPVLAVCQGLLAILGYYLFNVPDAVLWGIITGVASVVPFVGTAIVWIPISLLAFAKGDMSNGWWLLGWGAIVIGSSDNIIRMVLQKFMADVHPLITVFGVIVGLSLFGFFGLIFGPLLVSMFLLLVRVYSDEFISPRKVDVITGSEEKKQHEEETDNKD